jgi:UPF0716 protein FxsA
MLLRLLLAFTLVPLAELALLLQIGQWLGLGTTLALVIGTGLAGAWLARREGLRSWAAVQGELAAGRLPGEELLHALLVLIAGVILVTPGVLTDAAGLLLMIRPVRLALVRRLRTRLAARIQVGAIGTPDATGSGSDASDAPAEGGRRGRVIEL